MPSDNEIKQLMTEKVFPFFDGGGLDDILSRLETLEALSKKSLKDLALKKAKEVKKKREVEEKAAKKAVAEHKAELEKAKKKKEKKQDESRPDVKATVKLDNSGRAETIVADAENR